MATSAGELKYEVDGVTKSIDLLDDTSGDMKNTYQVLAEIAQSWENMSKKEQSALALQLAGKYQIDVVTAVLSNFDTAIQATASALDSFGSATEENQKYLDSLEGKTNLLKSTFQEMILGEGGISAFAKRVLDASTALLKFINTTGGAISTIGILVSVFALFNRQLIASRIIALTKEIGFLIKGLKNIPTAITGVISGLTALTTAEETGVASAEALELALGSLTAVLSAVTLAVSFGIRIWQKHKMAQEEASEASRKALADFASYTTQIDGLEKVIKDTNGNREQLNTILEANTEIFGENTQAIIDSEDAMQSALDTLKNYSAEQAMDTIRENIGEINNAIDVLNSTLKIGSADIATDTSAFTVYTLNMSSAKTIYDQKDALSDYIDALNKLDGGTGKYKKQIEAASSALRNMDAKIAEAENTVQTANVAFDIAGDKADSYKSTADAVANAMNNIEGSTDGATDATEELGNTADDTSKELQNEISEIERVFKFVEKQIDNEIGKIKEQKSEYDKSIKAQIDNIKDKIDALKEENNILKEQANEYKKVFDLVKDGVKEDIDALKDKKDKTSDYYDKLSDNTKNYYEKTKEYYEKEKSYYNDLIDKIKNANDEQKKSIELAEKEKALAEARSKKVRTYRNGQWTYGTDVQGVATAQAELDKYKSQLAQEERVSGLQEKISSLDEKISKLDEKRDARLKAIDAEKEKALASIDAQIDKLNKYIDKVDKLKNSYDTLAETKILKEYLKNGDIYDIDGLKKVEEQYANTQDKIKSNEDSIDSLDAKVKSLQKTQEAQDAIYDKQIKKLEDYKQRIDDLQLSYDKAFDKELLEKYGITFHDVMTGNITDVKELTERYKELRREQDGVQIDDDDVDGVELGKDTRYKATYTKPNKNIFAYQSIDENGKTIYYVPTRASGDSNISSTGAYVVGEDPNKEIVIGSKLNNGVLANLPKGSGVVNAKSTNTLAGLLNSLSGTVGASLSGNYNLTNDKFGGKSTIFNISNVNVDADDAMGFVEGLQNFANRMTQKAY